MVAPVPRMSPGLWYSFADAARGVRITCRVGMLRYVSARMTATLYAYPGCTTCRAARRWLDDHDVAYTLVDIARDPPSAAVLAVVAARAGIPVRKLFNTSGQLYRDGGYAARLATMDDAASLADLAAHGM